MSRSLVVSVFGGLVLVMWLAAWSVVGSAERSPAVGGLRSAPSPEADVQKSLSGGASKEK